MLTPAVGISHFSKSKIKNQLDLDKFCPECYNPGFNRMHSVLILLIWFFLTSFCSLYPAQLHSWVYSYSLFSLTYWSYSHSFILVTKSSLQTYFYQGLWGCPQSVHTDYQRGHKATLIPKSHVSSVSDFGFCHMCHMYPYAKQ